MDQNDREQFCAFFRRSRYDIIQAREGDGWGPLFTFSPCESRAAQKAAQMLLKMHRSGQVEVRHARRARLHDRLRRAAMDVVVATTFPERVQTVFHLEDSVVLKIDAFIEDEALAALEAALAPTPRP